MPARKRALASSASRYDPNAYGWRTDTPTFTFEDYRALYAALERGRSFAWLDKLLKCFWPTKPGLGVPLASSDPWLGFRLPDAHQAATFFRNPPAVRAALVRTAVPQLAQLRELPPLVTSVERSAHEWRRLRGKTPEPELDERLRSFTMAQLCAVLRRVGSGYEGPARCIVRHVGGTAIPPAAYLWHECERQEADGRVLEYANSQPSGDAGRIHAAVIRF